MQLDKTAPGGGRRPFKYFDGNLIKSTFHPRMSMRGFCLIGAFLLKKQFLSCPDWLYFLPAKEERHYIIFNEFQRFTNPKP